jgi:hypothetical protein
MTKDRRGTSAINQMPITSRRASSNVRGACPKPAKHSHLGAADRRSDREPVGGKGLRRSELISRLGFKKLSRGLRSLARLSAGDLDGYSGLIAKLPALFKWTLKVDPESGP